jgi:toxin ParE1/3/4
MEIEGAWAIHLTTAAETDFREILRWTAEQFGAQQANRYAGQLASTLTRLTEGPGVLGAKPRDDIMEGLCTLHMGDKGRHFVLFRATGTDLSKTIEVLRILHEAMDLPQHLPTNS